MISLGHVCIRFGAGVAQAIAAGGAPQQMARVEAMQETMII
jgi:hypothetical protein